MSLEHLPNLPYEHLCLPRCRRAWTPLPGLQEHLTLWEDRTYGGGEEREARGREKQAAPFWTRFLNKGEVDARGEEIADGVAW